METSRTADTASTTRRSQWKLYPVRKGAQTLIRDSSGTLELRYSTTGGEELSLHTDDAELTLYNDEERRFFFDRGFHWAPEAPVNR